MRTRTVSVAIGLAVLLACSSGSGTGGGGGSCPCTVGNSGLHFTLDCGQRGCLELNGTAQGIDCTTNGPVDDPSACTSGTDGGSSSGSSFDSGAHEAGPPVPPEAGAPACSDAGASGTCTIACGGPTLCPPTAACAPGEPCDVQCDHTSACQDLQILCDGATSCNVTCSQTSTCQGATIFCGTAGCTVNCTGTSACGGMKVVCGSGPCTLMCSSGAGGLVTQYCGSASSCSSTCM
jgi:hypothetical protein